MGTNYDTLYIDGKPFLELCDPTFEHVAGQDKEYLFTQTQNYRRLF